MLSTGCPPACTPGASTAEKGRLQPRVRSGASPGSDQQRFGLGVQLDQVVKGQKSNFELLMRAAGSSVPLEMLEKDWPIADKCQLSFFM